MPSEPKILSYRAADGHELHYRRWRPDGEPCGDVVALHGIQSHGGWYGWSSARLCAAGYDVRFLDRRGSGLNAPPRGHADSAAQLLGDVTRFLALVREEQTTTRPLVLLGVSWGGKLAAVVAGERPDLVDGLALLYPGLRARVRPNRWQSVMISAAARLGLGRRSVRIPLDDPALFTDQPQWQEFIRQDALSLHTATVSFLRTSIELDRLAETALPRIRCPVLCALAGRDRIIDNTATRRYLERFAARQCSIIEYPTAAHTLEFDPCREQFVSDVLDWMNGIRVA
ncbi:MAG: alpha/beta hydrolase [Planctomycetaceae bacterium]